MLCVAAEHHRTQLHPLMASCHRQILNTYTSGQVARGACIVTGCQRKELLGPSLLGVYGIGQCESKVRRLVAKRLVDLSPWLGRLRIPSRDFT